MEKVNREFIYKGEEIKAYCYIYREKDERNKCLLTDQNLVVLLKNIENVFPLNQIERIGIENRFTMFPLITGGILLPLSIIAIFNYLYDQWILIYLMIIGALSLYLGWVGHPVISVQLKGSVVETLQLKTASQPLRSFISFTNQVIKLQMQNELKAPYIYHIISKNEWELQKTNLYYEPQSLKTEGYIHCSQKEQLPSTIERFFTGNTDILILYINPFKVKAEIKYEAANDASGLFPHIYGPLNTDAVEKEELWIK